ncbi:Protein O-mannosyl-transferase C-terminal four TM domain [Trinorchestia longiramus]|nr:Protein O-mannosyl-transferase C-terminal four TM domain [Trinorchestia longiramus]
MITPTRSHQHDHTSTITLSRSHQHDHCTMIKPPRSNHHDNTTTITPPRSNHHDNTTTITPPRPHHHETTSCNHDLDYGANISIKNSMAMSGYLESWYELFPSEFTAACQQVTLATTNDLDTITWTVRFVNVSQGQVGDINALPGPEGRNVVRSGDHVVLTHRETGRSLRSHGHRAPVTRQHNQVCGYGDNYEVGPFETWQILIPGASIGTPLEPLHSEFMLKHYTMECFLANPDNTPLPSDWAYETSKEVTCTKNALASGLLWHLYWVNSTRLPLSETPSDYSMSLWEKVVEQHEAMVLGNQGLKPQPEDLLLGARPWMWPLMFRLQILASYDEDDIAEHKKKKLVPSNSTSTDHASSDLDKILDKKEEDHKLYVSSLDRSSKSTIQEPDIVNSGPEISVDNNGRELLLSDESQSVSGVTFSNFNASSFTDEASSLSFSVDSPNSNASRPTDEASSLSLSVDSLNSNASRPTDEASSLSLSVDSPKAVVLTSDFDTIASGSAYSSSNSGASNISSSGSNLKSHIVIENSAAILDANNTTALPIPNDDKIVSLLQKPKPQKKKSVKEIFAIFMNNPVLAYVNLLSFALTLGLMSYHLYKFLRDDNEPKETYDRRRVAVVACAWLSTCWAIHYLPFFCMSRVLYVHHYCPAYLYSCMLTGVVVSYMCESTASWLCPSRKDLLMSVFLCVPALAFLTTYFILFPLATYIEGKFSYPHPHLNKYLDLLYLGQHWVEFGYKVDTYEHRWATSIVPVEDQSWHNPDVNVSLYYTTPLDTRPVQFPHVDPVPASNFTAWKMKEL